jgi:hypothetical protein
VVCGCEDWRKPKRLMFEMHGAFSLVFSNISYSVPIEGVGTSKKVIFKSLGDDCFPFFILLLYLGLGIFIK